MALGLGTIQTIISLKSKFMCIYYSASKSNSIFTIRSEVNFIKDT